MVEAEKKDLTSHPVDVAEAKRAEEVRVAEEKKKEDAGRMTVTIPNPVFEKLEAAIDDASVNIMTDDLAGSLQIDLKIN